LDTSSDKNAGELMLNENEHPDRKKFSPFSICLIMTAAAALGIFAGWSFKLPLIIILGALPAALYELFRTSGLFTKAAAMLLLGALLITAYLLISGSGVQLKDFINTDGTLLENIKTDRLDLKTLLMSFAAVLSVFLFLKTMGIYTKWLSIVLLVCSFAVIYISNSRLFSQLIDYAEKMQDKI
jgi:hypothetical protein